VLKVALIDSAWFIVNVQVFALPIHGGCAGGTAVLYQKANDDPVAGVAVSVPCVPSGKL
jgi:hypothetical protein